MAIANPITEEQAGSPARVSSGWKVVLLISVVAAGLAIGALAGTIAFLVWPEVETKHAQAGEPTNTADPTESVSANETRGDEKLLEQDYAAALAFYRRVAEPQNASPLLRFRLAICQEGLGRWEQAQQLYSEIAHRHPDTVLAFACHMALARLCLRQGRVESAMRPIAQAILQANESAAQIGAALPQARLTFVATLLRSRLQIVPPEPLQPFLAWPPWQLEHPEETWFWLRGLGEAATRPWPVIRELVQVTPGTDSAEMVITLQWPQGSLLDLLHRLAKETGQEIAVSDKATASLATRSLQSLRLVNLPLSEVLLLLLEPEGCVWYCGDKKLHVLAAEEVSLETTHPGAESAGMPNQESVAVTQSYEQSLRQKLAKARLHSVLATLNRLLLENSSAPLPHLQRVFWLMGLCHYHLGQLKEAATWWDRLLHRWPQTVEAFYVSFNLGVLYWQQGELELAKRLWMRAADQAPGHPLTPLAYLYVARAELEDLHVESAIVPLRRATYAPPGSPTRCLAQLWLACCWLYLNNAPAAHNLLVRERRWLQAEPYRTGAAFLDALARTQGSETGSLRLRQAEDLLTALLQVQDWQMLEPLGPLLAGQAWVRLHLPEQAGRVYQSALPRARSLWREELLLAYAESCFLCRQFAQARQAVQESLRSSRPDHVAAAHWLLARCALREGNPEESLEHARQVLLHPSPVPREALLRLMGEAYLALGDSRRAAECFAGRIPDL